jgi:peroxiredoxin
MPRPDLAVRVGAPAPDFTLPSTAGEPATLSRHRGARNVLLAFFPLAFTRVCTAELCAMTEDGDRFESATTKVYGISVDSVPTLSAFRQQHQITVELLSDFRREVSRRYGTLLDAEFFSRRAYVLVDRHGVVRWTFAEAELGDRRDNAELFARIRDLA